MIVKQLPRFMHTNYYLPPPSVYMEVCIKAKYMKLSEFSQNYAKNEDSLSKQPLYKTVINQWKTCIKAFHWLLSNRENMPEE